MTTELPYELERTVRISALPENRVRLLQRFRAVGCLVGGRVYH